MFSTKEYDLETGLSYYGYRYYNASIGKWITRDPLGEYGGMNLYGMVGNDPINYFDDEGMDRKRKREDWSDNKNRKKGAENRKPGGDRERNVKPKEGEEHSRVAKGQQGQHHSSNICADNPKTCTAVVVVVAGAVIIVCMQPELLPLLGAAAL